MGIQTALWTSVLFETDSSFIDYLIKAPSKRTPRIQELHLFIGHALCEVIENNLLKKQNFTG
jgi:D-sedoheptulose 7-phosphate isomerase